jgi:hypothetical protein
MNRVALLTTVAVALAMSGVPAIAQMQQKGPDEKGAPPHVQGPPGSTPGGQLQVQPKDQGSAQQGAEKAQPKDKGTKGTAQSKEQPGKGTAQTEPKDKTTKGTAEKGVEPKDKTAEKGSAGRVQLSEQQRTSVSQTILKDTHINRVTNVNVSINVGTRVPRSVRLVGLPASVIAIVPAYRSYRYFVVNEQICIVDPATYEIVEIIFVSGQTAGSGGPATLILTEEEKAIILREVDTNSGSTLALGALAEDADVPRGVQVRVFPEAIVLKVPKVRGYRYFTAENRVAIVDPHGAKVQLVIGQRR